MRGLSVWKKSPPTASITKNISSISLKEVDTFHLQLLFKGATMSGRSMLSRIASDYLLHLRFVTHVVLSKPSTFYP